MENCPFLQIFPFGFKSSKTSSWVLASKGPSTFMMPGIHWKLGPWLSTDLSSATTNKLCDLGATGFTSLGLTSHLK